MAEQSTRTIAYNNSCTFNNYTHMDVEGSYLIMTQGDVTLPILLLFIQHVSLSLWRFATRQLATKSLGSHHHMPQHNHTQPHRRRDIVNLDTCHVQYYGWRTASWIGLILRAKGALVYTHIISHCVGPVYTFHSIFHKVFHPRCII